MRALTPALPIATLLLLAACANGGSYGRPDVQPTLAAAEGALRGGSPQVALQIDDAILAGDPRNVSALLNRGDAQTALRQSAAAARSYDDALQADPHSIVARIGLGRLRLADDPTAAEALFLEASQSDPHNATAWNDLGVARDLLGRHQDAQEAYRQAISLDASMRGPQVNLAMSLAGAGPTKPRPTAQSTAEISNLVPAAGQGWAPEAGKAPSASRPIPLANSAPPVARPVASLAASSSQAPSDSAISATSGSASAGSVVTSPRIVLSATADAWMQVRDSSGQVLLSRILHRGKSWPVPAQPKLVLTTGNAGGTNILLDGAAIAPLGAPGAVRRDISLDAGLLSVGKLAAASSSGTPAAPQTALRAPPPSVAAASIAPGSAAPGSAAASTALSGASPTASRPLDTAGSLEPPASTPPTHSAATTTRPTASVTQPRTVASATADATPRDDHGLLSAALSPGMHAMTVGVDGVTGTTGLIWPGDRVDVILRQEMASDADLPGQRVAAEMVLSKVRVIALDQQFGPGAAPGSLAKPARTVTFEVNGDQAQRVSAATRLGRLWLAVRSAETAHQKLDPHSAPPTVWASEALAVPGPVNPPGANHVVRVFPGVADSKEFHF